ncbi:MAG: Ig-like domain-containing protein [Lachnospiraceae bacterium]|nr:Ig-like domain-containing protein [Lachnospiraceae bacterium]
MAAGDTVMYNAGLSDGTYTSEMLVLDVTAPEITGTYSSAVINTKNSRDYFDTTSTKLTLTVDDRNIRDKELMDAMSGDRAYLIGSTGSNIFSSTNAGKYISGLTETTVHTSQSLEGTTSGYGTTYTIPLSTEGNYDLLISGYKDLAGNAAVIDSGYNPYVCVDVTDPTDVSFTYSVSSSAGWWPVNYKTLGYAFANATLTVTASAKDVTSGIQSFTFYVTDENGTVTTIIRDDITPIESKSTSITVPISGSNFKGSVRVVAADWSDNTTEKSEGQIVESAGKFASAGSATITTLTSPSWTVNGVDYYNTDVTFNLTLEETYSGLRSYNYTAGSQISATYNYAEVAGTNLTATKTQNITYTYSQNLTLSSSANNVNDVSVNASYVSNTGYTDSVEQKYNIDITKPTIEVTWDNNNSSNETYYNATRTATVVITERNFDPDDVEFTITNTDGTMPSISGWSTTGSGDSTRHTATVTFSADGDYTFTVAFQDMAANKADYTTVDEFTVDQTNPTYTVSYDNNSYENVYYYDANRVATIDVYEHNFDASAVTISVTKDGASITPVVSGWSTNGDHNVATVSFNTDGEYTFTISGMDMATNPMDDYNEDHFVVDTTEPVVEIEDVQNYSANNGRVEPAVKYSDINYDANSTVIELDGYYNGVETIEGLAPTVSGETVTVKMNDFSYDQETDDMYTLTATVYDLAGNSAEASVVFSVNRFGSVYTFDTATDALVGENGKYYTDEEQDIVVIETNVDTLEESSIAKSTNGSLTTLTEDVDYSVKSSGNEVSWKQYTYTVDKSNFKNEGEYILTFTSVDRATNSNTNEMKVAFVVDKTAPTVMVSGVADGGQYRQDSMKISISASDNVRMSSVTVTNDGESEEFDYETVTSGAFPYTMNSKNSRQTLKVVATDAAGNESAMMSLVDENGNITELSEVSYLLTTNLWIQFISNKLLLTLAVVALAAVLALSWWFLAGRKKWIAGSGKKKQGSE